MAEKRADRRLQPVTLDIQQVLSVLPQRFPFVMVDRVTEVVAAKYARGQKCIAYNEPYFLGHFPRRPIMPGVLILESMSQLGAVLAYVSEPFDTAHNLLYYLAIDKAKFHHTVVPGDRMDVYVEVLHHRSNVWKFTGEVTVDGTVCAEAELLASVVDR
jgi:3-hydroxyacyl-[acyl-carrier-protein] dehydratase